VRKKILGRYVENTFPKFVLYEFAYLICVEVHVCKYKFVVVGITDITMYRDINYFSIYQAI
jgi:hypothetical protein